MGANLVKGFGMGIKTKQTKIMSRSTSQMKKKDLRMETKQLETVNIFIYLGTTITDEGSKIEFLRRCCGLERSEMNNTKRCKVYILAGIQTVTVIGNYFLQCRARSMQWCHHHNRWQNWKPNSKTKTSPWNQKWHSFALLLSQFFSMLVNPKDALKSFRWDTTTWSHGYHTETTSQMRRLEKYHTVSFLTFWRKDK